MSKLIFPYAVNSIQPLRNIQEYTKFGFIENGHELIDLSLGSCGCFPLGFKRYDIIDKVTEQMKNMSFCSGEFYTTNSSVLELSERLHNITNGYRSMFSLSGSDAIEGALRLAQLYNGRNKFLGFKKSYHGSTYLSSSVSDATYMTDYFGKDSRCIISDYNLNSITNDLCAVLIETRSWQNGLYDPGQEFWINLRKQCTDKNIVLIIDDIAMCGGKTGSFIGWTGVVEPDIFTMGKALTSGYYPLSATLVNDKIFDSIKHTVFCHGFSYSFSLSGIYSTLAYLDIIEQEHIFDNHAKIIHDSTELFNELMHKGLISNFNNYGTIFNLKLNTNKPVDSTFEKFLYQHGLNAGMWNEAGSGLLIIIPLNPDQEYFEKLHTRLTVALRDYSSANSVSY